MRFQRLYFFGWLLMGSLLPVSCQTTQTPDTVQPVSKVLVSSSVISDLSVDALKARFPGVFAQFIVNPITVYRIEYHTTNTDGQAVTASGALLVPKVSKAVPMLSLQHGTIAADSDAPSNFQSTSEAYSVGSVFASTGYIIAAPDYIGYGASNKLPHTYEHRNGLATASLDMLRAAREFIAENKISWDNRLILAGYSEGGYATMSLQKKLEEEVKGEFKLIGSSCGAGAYDKPAFVNYLLNPQTAAKAQATNLYVWVLLTYNRIYNLNRPMTYYFKQPYADRITADGFRADLKGVALNDIVTDSFRQGILTGTDTDFLKAVADNDIHDWRPAVPTRLYHGDADQTVPYLNSVNTYQAMQKRGAPDVRLETIAGGTHGSAVSGFVMGTYFFLSSL